MSDDKTKGEEAKEGEDGWSSPKRNEAAELVADAIVAAMKPVMAKLLTKAFVAKDKVAAKIMEKLGL